jgi:CheY-like chemotaxis protein
MDDANINLEKINEDLRAALAETAKAEQERLAYIAQITHNTRTSLNTINGMVAIARHHIDDHDKILDCLNKIELSCLQITEIVNEVTSMAELDDDHELLLNEAPAFIREQIWDVDFSAIVPDVPLAGKRMLVAEDNELNAEMVKEILEQHGIIVDVAEDGMKVIDLLMNKSENYFDCILMDINMPVLNGYSTTQRIRNIDRDDLKVIPIIATTASAYLIDIRCAKNAGMNAHVAKPFNVDELLKIFTHLLPRRQAV